MVVELRTARDLGKPLNLLRFGREEWRVEDRVMAVALTLYEDSLCSGCGHPRDRAYNPDMEGYYVTREHTCQGCAARDRHEAELRDKRDQRKPKAGLKVGVADEAWDEGYRPDPKALLEQIAAQ